MICAFEASGSNWEGPCLDPTRSYPQWRQRPPPAQVAPGGGL